MGHLFLVILVKLHCVRNSNNKNIFGVALYLWFKYVHLSSPYIYLLIECLPSQAAQLSIFSKRKF